MQKFQITRYRFYIQAGKEGLQLPLHRGSAIRGVLGRALRRLSCTMPGKECNDCSVQANCPYAYLFETIPAPKSSMMKGYGQVPRPYVIEYPLEDRPVPPHGETFFDVLLFGQAISLFPYFLVAFSEGGKMGLGAGKKPYHLVRMEAHNDLSGGKSLLYEHGNNLAGENMQKWTGSDIVQVAAAGKEKKKVIIDFTHPTLLKADRQFIDNLKQLSFQLFMRNVFRRFSTLYVHHHNEQPTADYAALLELAKGVNPVEIKAKKETWERYSFRHERRNRMDGFSGSITFTGILEPFIPYLLLGQWIHIGKWSAFGMGQYRCSFLAE